MDENPEQVKKKKEIDSDKCMQLALQGERLCKQGNYLRGVKYFQAAIQAGTDNLNILSVIYCQLGNAYFYLGEYTKAIQYHKFDFTLVTFIGDKIEEAKAISNLGNTFKVMGKFDDAILWFERYLNISREIKDKSAVGKALYYLANVYHMKGKQIGKEEGYQENGKYSNNVTEYLLKALKYYKESLTLIKQLEDEITRSQILGNIGNTYYILGNFQRAIYYHNEKLKTVHICCNKVSERRTHTHLANSYVFLHEFNKAVHHYKKSLLLAQELNDQIAEAKVCYFLGNTYTLLNDFPEAVDSHLRHLTIVKQLDNKVEEGRAYWCLSNIYSTTANYTKALDFANLHLQICKELGDLKGLDVAEKNVKYLQDLLYSVKEIKSERTVDFNQNDRNEDLSPNDVGMNAEISQTVSEDRSKATEHHFNLSLFHKPSLKKGKKEDDALLDWIEKLQSKRMDEQRVTMSFLPGFQPK